MIGKKIAMLGMWGVGKTSLVQQFVSSIYDEKYHSTLGVKVDKKVVDVDGQEINLMLWDIAGAEDNFTVPLHYIKGSAGYLLVIDGTRKASLAKAIELIEYVEKGIGSLPFVACVNKSDLEWELSAADIESALLPFGGQFLSTSAKTGENVELAFNKLARKLIPAF